MNILFFYSTPIDPLAGGIQRVTSCLGNYFEKRGINVFYLSASGQMENNDIYIKNHFFLPDQTKIFTHINIAFYLDFLKKNSINIVINQSGITPDITNFILATKKTTAKLITVMHSSLFGIYGLSNHLNRYYGIFKKLYIANAIDYLLIFLFKIKYGRFYKNLIKNSHRVILLSDHFVKEMWYFGGKKNCEKKIVCIPNPLPINCVKIATKNFELLYVGRFSYSKRLDLLLKVWEKVSLLYPDWSLTLVGDGKENEKLHKLVNKLRLKRVSFQGFQKPEKYYETASIFCLTSATESFGLVLLEAMTFGVVPIAFNSYPNLIEIIDDNINGKIVTPFKIDEYIEKLSDLIEDKEKLVKMANSAIAKSKHYDVDAIGERWLVLFNELSWK